MSMICSTVRSADHPFLIAEGRADTPRFSLYNRNEKLLNDPVRLRQISERIPAGRWGHPKDFAGPIVFLASNASQYVCGELLVVDGVSVSYSFSHSHPILHVSRDGWAGECRSATPETVLYPFRTNILIVGSEA